MMCTFNADWNAYEIDTCAGMIHVHQDGSVVLFRNGATEGEVVFDASPVRQRPSIPASSSGDARDRDRDRLDD